MRRTASLRPALLAVLAVAALAAPPVASAQTETVGRITGELTLATAGAELDATALAVDLIVLEAADVTGTVDATVDGTSFAVEVPLDAERRYVPRVRYQGVQYFGQPVSVTHDAPEVVAELPPLYEATAEAPDLVVTETVVTAVALDRGTGQLGLIRDDFVTNPSDRVYVGGENGVTLRLPTPEGTLDASGENADGEFDLADGVLQAAVPLRALGGTSIVTRYVVAYDLAEDEYVLRVTTPLPADRLVVRVPEAYVHDLELLGDGREGERDVIEVSDGEPVPLRTFVLEDAAPGDSLIVRLDGLALRRNSNPLAETPGNLIAGAIALAVVGAAGAFAVVRTRGAGS
ncbi:MAG: hypothetical protein AB7F65_03870 [Dehalococcoidia bacterium]